MHNVVFHIGRLSARRLGIENENPIDPRVRQRADALDALADLLETEPDLVALEIRAVLLEHVMGPVPEDPFPPLGSHAERVLAGCGFGCDTSTATHLRVLDALAAAAQHDSWEVAAVVATIDVEHRDACVDATALHRWEVEAAMEGVDPGEAYFARRASLDEAGRRALLERCRRRADRDETA